VKSPVRLVQLLASVAIPQITANIRNGLLPGTLDRQAQNAPRVGTSAEDVTPAAHMIAFAAGLADCIDAFSVCTPKNGSRSNTHRKARG
jgi:hypothetical protein